MNAPVLRSDVPWLMTATGTCFPLTESRPADTEPHHRAAMLAKKCRFAGATVVPWSVAEHAVLVSRIAEEMAATADVPGGMSIPAVALAALIHDDHEAYLGDMPTPVKWALRSIDDRAIVAWEELVARIDGTIHASHGLPWPLPRPAADIVKRADLVALATEKRDLMPAAAPGHPDWDIPLPEPWPDPCRPSTDWTAAMRLYLDRLAATEQWRALAAH